MTADMWKTDWPEMLTEGGELRKLGTRNMDPKSP